MALINLAKKKKLPRFQYMDRKTINWIEENNPFLNEPIKNESTVKFLNFAHIIKKYLPLQKWFINSKKIDTIHGLRHSIRVASYTILLNDLLGNKIKKENLIIIAMLHDIRRITDKKDEEHGIRATKWFLQNISQIEKHFKIKLSDSNINEIYHGIYYHEIPYDILIKEEKYKKYKNIIDIVKTADALDRYRQPDIKWWINNDYIRLVPPLKIKKNAYKLVLDSEKNYINGINNIESIFMLFKDYENK